MNMLHLEVVLKTATRKADDAVTIKFETTAEMSNEQFAEIDSWRKKTGHLLFKKDMIKGAEIPRGDTKTEGETPSQALRRSLYATWKYRNDHEKDFYQDFDDYYTNAMMGFKRAVDKKHPAND